MMAVQRAAFDHFILFSINKAIRGGSEEWYGKRSCQNKTWLLCIFFFWDQDAFQSLVVYHLHPGSIFSICTETETTKGHALSG
jgi:hypothetical protein